MSRGSSITASRLPAGGAPPGNPPPPPDGAPEPLVPLGTLTRPHGIRGELRFRPFNPDSATLAPGVRVILRRDGAVLGSAVVVGIRPHRDVRLLTLDTCDSATAARALAGVEVCVPASALPPLAPGEFYHRDLVGLAVVTPRGEALGTVDAVLPLPSADVCVVRRGQDERLVPLIADVVKEVDLAGRRLVIDPLPGLLDG